MGDRQVDWLRRELPGLVRDGVLDSAAAARVAAHYDTRVGRSSNWMLAALGTLGALLVGGGIVLLIAHNWDEFGRPLRIGLAVGQLLLAQALAAFVLLRKRDAVGWREAAGGLLAVAVAASIALISQTYHIPGELADFLLVCAFLVVGVPYLLDAQVSLVMFYGALLVRSGWEGWGNAGADGFDLALAALGVPLLVSFVRDGRECRLLLGLVAVLAVPLGAAELGHHGSGLWPFWIAAVLALWHAIGTAGADPWRQPFRIVARIGLPMIALGLTFGSAWTHLATATIAWNEAAVAGVLALAIAAGLYAPWLARRGTPDARLASFAAVATATGFAFARNSVAGVAPLVMNVYVAALGLSFLAHGFREVRLGLVNYGLFLLAALAVLRFADSDLSFVVRGIGFIVVGLLFLGANLVLVSRRREVRR